MFPFLAPIHKNGYTTRQGVVQITFMADSPHVSRSTSAASAVPTTDEKEIQQIFDDNSSMKSRNSEQNLSIASASRPNSRAKSKTSSQPTSARSEKSSPLPVPVKETIPPVSRHKNKGLDMSAGMMELFGSAPGESAFGAGSSFKPIEDHDAAYNRALKNARGLDLSKPGPEWYEGFEKMDMTDIELPPDPNCPAEKLLQQQRRDYAGLSSKHDEEDDWVEAKHDVLQDDRKKLENFESLPGPDIGADEEEEEEEEQLESSSSSSASHFQQIDSPTAQKEGEDDICDSPVGSSKNGSSFGGFGGGGGGAPKNENADNQRDEKDAEDSDAEKNRTNELGEEKEKSGSKSGEGGMVVILIRNAQIINDDAIFVSDVLIVDGIISNVAPNIEAPENAEIIDATGKMVLPAGIDVHTRITAPDSADDLAVGCKSALAGGTATIVELVTPKNGESPSAAFKRVKQSLEKATCNVSISVVLNSWNDSIKSDMEKLVSEGVNSFVVDVDDDGHIFEIMEHSSKLGAHVRFFPTTSVSFLEKKMLALGVTGPEGYPQSRPESYENCRVNTICNLGQFANCPLSIISVSSADSIQAIEKSRANGGVTHAEISSAAVVANSNGYLNRDLKQAAAHLTDVPLRGQGASDRLISALSSAPLAVCTSGHHAISSTARLAAKDFTTMPKGTTGAEERLAVVWEKAVRNGRIDPMRFVAVTSSNAAKMFNLYPRKGKIAIGADADIVIWDGGAKRVLSSNDAQSSVDVSLYDGVTVHSAVIATIVNGNIVWKNGSAVNGAPNSGFLALAPNSPYLFSVIGRRDNFGANVQKVEREAGGVKQNGASPPVKKISGEFDRDRNRKHTMESSIDFGGGANRGPRNPPGGRKVMHFVKKVPTSEEEKAAKKKEQDKKSRQYLHVRDRIVEKRKNDEYDDEILSLTQQVLERNADIYTFWNIRRTAIEKRIEQNSKIQENSEIAEEEKANSQRVLDNLLNGELFLSYECIKGNPKSYSAWFQRAWVLERQKTPDFEKELVLCEKALKLDCRNFHCWDHRRIVARLAKRTEEQEIEFSNKLIEDNFSNYSAWHYRSISLKKYHFEKNGQLKLADETIAEELDKVKNAFYMDADDQSAWSYTRWLLEVGSGKEFLRPESSTAISLITANYHGNRTTLVFTRALTLDKVLTFVETDDTNSWRAFSSTSPNPSSSRVWQFLSDSSIRIIDEKSQEFIDIREKSYINLEILRKIYDLVPVELPKSISTLLDDCKQLAELEPNNKWPIYMRTLIQIEYTPTEANSEIIANLEKLASTLDPNRSQLYKSVASRQQINIAIRKFLLEDEKKLAARYLNLTSLEGLEYVAGIVEDIDLAGNQLTEIHRIVLPNLTSLTVDENPIKIFKQSSSLSNLKFLSIANTEVSNIDDIVPFLQHCPALERLVFAETKLVDKTEQLRNQLPGIRLIPHWL
ncbi:unnamed protein product [Caenorhabditis angaria]|uniref:Geranylgeranyl transferase type-2 subunit alpha n=1 Tax=Caenorhabditis angaria TaxID=860376 RepID=A0A9P1N2Z1_9PELO|nr:unnamed protein product [Caenorhabditis angaria]